jgi:hypothetical protein
MHEKESEMSQQTDFYAYLKQNKMAGGTLKESNICPQ